MANIPISQLPEATSIDDNSEFAISQNAVTEKIKFGEFRAKDIDELAAAAAATGTDLIAISQNGTTKKIKISDLLSGVDTDISDIEGMLDKTVEQDTTYSADASTVNVKIDKVNIKTGATSSANKSLPVASSTQAGVMNTATYNAVQENSENIDAILNGSVAVEGLPANPSKSQLSQAWKDETGRENLINHASIYDIDNDKIWTYYENITEWKSVDAKPQVDVAQATNTTLGIVKGNASTKGRIFVESNGEMSVNGWDDTQNAITKNAGDIATNTASITSLTTTVNGKQDKLTFDTAPKSGSNNPVTSGGVYTEFGKVAYLGPEVTGLPSLIDAGNNYMQLGTLLIQWGTGNINASPNGTSSGTGDTMAITFPKPYAATPHFYTTIQNGNTAGATINASTISATQCLVIARSTTSTNLGSHQFWWLAIGQAK